MESDLNPVLLILNPLFCMCVWFFPPIWNAHLPHPWYLELGPLPTTSGRFSASNWPFFLCTPELVTTVLVTNSPAYPTRFRSMNMAASNNRLDLPNLPPCYLTGAYGDEMYQQANPSNFTYTLSLTNAPSCCPDCQKPKSLLSKSKMIYTIFFSLQELRLSVV